MKNINIPGQYCIIKDKPESITNHNNVIRERAKNYGIDALMDEEIICLLTGIDVEIIRQAVHEFGLSELIKYCNSLTISKAQRCKLELLNLYHRRMSIASLKSKPMLDSSEKAGKYALSLFIGKPYECFYVLCLDAQNRLNYAALLMEGTLNEAPVYPRIVVETALHYRANSVILSHQHPGGSMQPSSADIEVTRKIKDAMRPIGIKVMDHIIVAENKFLSFAEKGLL